MKLTFEISAYRDWSAIYCQMGYLGWTKEFREQYGWGTSDIIFRWNGSNTEVIRDPNEHLEGLFEFVKSKLKQDPNFLQHTAKAAYDESMECEKFFEDNKNADYDTMSWGDFKNHFNTFIKKFIHTTPNIFIGIYLPQALENHPEEKETYKEGVEVLMQTRDKIDYIVAPMGNQLADIMAKAIMRKLNLPEALSRFITIEEFNEVCDKEGNVNLKQMLESRKEKLVVAGGKVLSIPLEDYLEEKGWELKKHDTDVTELKGMSCSKKDEIIVGTVVKVLNKRELDKAKEGDIIVAPMTTPEYAPIISKAKAIITNEGGITCHAAIFSRETGVPAIVGTKIATDVLKDGDMVEVDTEKGIVRKIK